MSCDARNCLTNHGGVMGLGLTRPIAMMLLAPQLPLVPHWMKPPGETPPFAPIPPGPQAAPAFIRCPGVPAMTYDPPAYADDAWVPGTARRMGA